MSAKELRALAERCEKATGPDRKLDLAIAVAVNRDGIFDARYEWRWGFGGDEIEAWEAEKCKPSGYLDPEEFCQRFTASLDAAMSLVPEGATVRLYVAPEATAAFIGPVELAAATPALALCAAALRARAEKEAHRLAGGA